MAHLFIATYSGSVLSHKPQMIAEKWQDADKKQGRHKKQKQDVEFGMRVRQLFLQRGGKKRTEILSIMEKDISSPHVKSSVSNKWLGWTVQLCTIHYCLRVFCWTQYTSLLLDHMNRSHCPMQSSMLNRITWSHHTLWNRSATKMQTSGWSHAVS